MDGDREHGGHERYEALAVGHVLGGLDEVAAADFRSHLLECRPCRRRVAELRDLADDLEVAAREERAQLQLKTEVRDEGDRDDDEDGGLSFPWGLGRWVTITVVGLAVAALFGLLAWNLALSERLTEVLDTTEVRERVLAELAEGVQVPATFQGGARGMVVVDGRDTTASLAGIPELEQGEAVMVWLGDTTLHKHEVYAPPEIVDTRLAFNIDDSSARRLVVTVEPVPTGDRPDGLRIVEAELRPGGGPSPGSGSDDEGAAGGGARPPGAVRLLGARH